MKLSLNNFSCYLTLLLFILFSSSGVKGQASETVLSPRFDKKRLQVQQLPFNKFEMIDARFDSTLFYINETGLYPPVQTIIERNALNSLSDYLQSAISNFPSGGKSVLIILNQCRVTNRQLIKRKDGESPWRIRNHAHEYILFDADLYYKSGDDKYQKILNVHQRTPVSITTKWFREGLEKAYDNLINAVYMREGISDANKIEYKKIKKKLLRQAPFYNSIYDSSFYTQQQLKAAALQRWQLSAIFSASLQPNGVFENFDAFKDFNLKAGEIIKGESNDSIYHFTATGYPVNRLHSKPWAIVFDGRCYINIFNDTYLPLEKSANSFYFYVPATIPDMYAILSFEFYSHTSPGYGVASSGNLLIDIASVAATTSFAAIQDKAVKNKTERNGLKGNYRYCLIDMDNGDFIYSATKNDQIR